MDRKNDSGERRHTMTDEWAPFASVCGISLLLVLLVSTSPKIVVVVVVVVVMMDKWPDAVASWSSRIQLMLRT